MRFGGGQSENIGGQLQGNATLTTAAGNTQTGNPGAAALFNAFFAFAQRIGQAFQNRAVQVGAGMNVSKADDGTFGFGTRHFKPRGPVGL